MTGAELQARALSRCGEDPANPIYYTAAEALAALNEAQRLFCFLTLCLETTQPWSLSAGQVWYKPLDTFTDWIVPLRVRIAGAGGAKVYPARLADLDALNPNWQAETGPPERYVSLGSNLLAFCPHPAAAGTTLSITYVRSPVDLTAATSPEIPEEYHPALLDYATPRLRAKEGGQELAKTISMFEDFLAAAKKLAAYVRARSIAQGYDHAPPEHLRYDTSREVKRNG